jgi:hypothetical protein
MGRVPGALSAGLIGIGLLFGASTSGASSTRAEAAPVVHGDLVSVSCAAPNNCVAVGSKLKAAFADHWNGSSWNAVTLTSPSANRTLYLSSVSCVNAFNCTAVGTNALKGFSGGRPGFWSTLVEHWNGTTWSMVPSPNRAVLGNDLAEISCTRADDCIAVGSSVVRSNRLNFTRSKTLVEMWNGSHWTIVPSPNGPYAVNSLSHIACTSTTNCWAAGASAEAQPPVRGQVSLLEHWNGLTWSTTSRPEMQEINSLSCPSVDDCTAVGQSGSTIITIVTQHWNGSTWSIVKTSGVPNEFLEDIYCFSPASCTAVGTTGTGFAMTYIGYTLVVHWNGSVWSIVLSPPIEEVSGPSQAEDSLTGIACTSASDCTAVGVATDGTALIEHWNGSIWSIVQR